MPIKNRVVTKGTNYPRGVERDYHRVLRRLFARAHEVASRGFAPLLSLAARKDADDDPPRPAELTEASIRAQLAWIRAQVRLLVSDADLNDELVKLASKLDGSTLRQIGANLGIDLYEGNPSLQALIETWIAENVAIIEATLIDGPARVSLLSSIEHRILDAWRRGVTADDLAKVLERRLDVSRNRSRFIARDQISSLNGQVVQERHGQAGIAKYRWSTSMDERVRKEHRNLNGTIQNWSQPPIVAPGRREHPGGDYLCRCTAIPIMPSWMTKD